MIVKNEMKVKKKRFDSVFKYIDYWVICDTSSTDGKENFIRNYFIGKKIEGELLEDKPCNCNRLKVVETTYNKADYLLIMDYRREENSPVFNFRIYRFFVS